MVDNSVRLDLYLPDEHVSGNSNHVNQILVDEGFARKCEESYSSKVFNLFYLFVYVVSVER